MENFEKLAIIKSISGLTQKNLAKTLGVSFATLNSWVNKRSKPHKKAEQKINKLYLVYAYQEELPSGKLEAKKQIILNKQRRHKNVLGEIMSDSNMFDFFLLSLCYNANRADGNTLSFKQMKKVLFSNKAVSDKSLVEQLEIKNYQAAWQYLIDQFYNDSKKRIDEKMVLKIHGILTNAVKKDSGNFRSQEICSDNGHVLFTKHKNIQNLMKKIIKDINYANKRDVVSSIANILSQFEKIHPFFEANGKVNQLIVQAMLFREGFPPAIFDFKKNRTFQDCLRKAQIWDNFLFLEDFLCDAILFGFRILEEK